MSMCAAAGLKPAVLGLSPSLILAMTMPLAKSLHFSLNSQSYFFLTVTKSKKLTPLPSLTAGKDKCPSTALRVLCFTPSFLCRLCSSLLHSAAQIPSRQTKDQNSVSALIFTGLTSVWIIALLSAPLLLICISLREIRAWPSVFKAS